MGNGDWADMLAEMDHNVGQTLDAVDRLGVRDNTIEPFCLRPKKSGGDWVEFSKINACPTPRNQTSINSELSYSGSARSFGDASSSEAIQRSLIYTKPCKSPLDGPTTTFTCPYQKFYPPLSGKRMTLLPPPPLRTHRTSFPVVRSSLSNVR
jgi:hypothetical protein